MIHTNTIKKMNSIICRELHGASFNSRPSDKYLLSCVIEDLQLSQLDIERFDLILEAMIVGAIEGFDESEGDFETYYQSAVSEAIEKSK